jgi:hypothetical protein
MMSRKSVHVATSARVKRAWYLGATVATITVGLGVHLGGAALGPALRDITGDALWAAMMVWIVSAVVPRAALPARGAGAYTICVLVELSQLIHAPFLDAVRATRLGHLVLGSGFDARDLVAYALGVALATSVERACVRWRAART